MAPSPAAANIRVTIIAGDFDLEVCTEPTSPVAVEAKRATAHENEGIADNGLI